MILNGSGKGIWGIASASAVYLAIIFIFKSGFIVTIDIGVVLYLEDLSLELGFIEGTNFSPGLKTYG